jgi:hypothetical protein
MDIFEIWYWKLIFKSVEKSKFGYNQTKVFGISHEDLSVFPIVDSDICSSTIQRTTVLMTTNCCISVVMHAVFMLLVATYAAQHCISH